MGCGSGLSFNDLLGLGYNGYARIGNYYLRLLSSSITETDNLILPESSYGSESGAVNGQVPSIGRRSLKISLNAEFTPAMAYLVQDSCLSWRTLYNEGAPAFEVELVVARGEGYRSDEAYVNFITISNQDNGLTTCQIDMDAYVWNYLDSGPVVEKTGYVPFDIFDFQYKPIPHWANCVSLDRLDAACLNWNLTLRNNWQYQFLLEGNLLPTGPANPRLTYPGPLDTEISINVLAKPNSRPPESSPGSVTIRIPNQGVLTKIMTLQYSLLVRHPSRAYTGFGSPNTPIGWQTSYYALGAVPLWSVGG